MQRIERLLLMPTVARRLMMTLRAGDASTDDTPTPIRCCRLRLLFLRHTPPKMLLPLLYDVAAVDMPPAFLLPFRAICCRFLFSCCRHLPFRQRSARCCMREGIR